eukprot:m.20037 g.20037  ORF g.20037 m.20037 type:complete len:403 (-) comp3493_c0_seq2:184-1392(-)
MAERIVVSAEAQGSVDAYLEYRRIVGDDDGGKLFTDAEYEAYKARVLPMRTQNRLYVSWGIATAAVDCKLVGPETMCLCGHRYRQHRTDFEHVPSGAAVDVACRASGCACSQYTYIPRVLGSAAPRCTCKHLASEHSPARPNACDKAGCMCRAYASGIRCECGQPYVEHRTLVETRAERQARGQPVQRPGRSDIYQAMGGLTHFSSLAEGPTRQAAAAAVAAKPDMDPALFTRKKLTEEEEMAIYEKRYQERLKAERDAKQADRARVREAAAPPRALPASRAAPSATAPSLRAAGAIESRASGVGRPAAHLVPTLASTPTSSSRPGGAHGVSAAGAPAKATIPATKSTVAPGVAGKTASTRTVSTSRAPTSTSAHGASSTSKSGPASKSLQARGAPLRPSAP